MKTITITIACCLLLQVLHSQQNSISNKDKENFSFTDTLTYWRYKVDYSNANSNNIKQPPIAIIHFYRILPIFSDGKPVNPYVQYYVYNISAIEDFRKQFAQRKGTGYSGVIEANAIIAAGKYCLVNYDITTSLTSIAKPTVFTLACKNIVDNIFKNVEMNKVKFLSDLLVHFPVARE